MERCKNTYLALDVFGNNIDTAHAHKHQVYRCSFCKRKLYLRMSAYGKKHFVHQSDQYKKSHNFEVHKRMQKVITKHLKHFQLPYRLEYDLNKRFRADIIFGVNNRYYVIEIQRSPITINDINRREQFYKNLGIRLIWILSKEQKNMKLTLWQQYLLVINKNIIFYDELKNKYYHLLSYYKISNKKTKCSYRKFEFPNYLQNQIMLQRELKKDSVDLNSFLYYLKRWKQNYNFRRKKKDILAYLFYEVQQTIHDVGNEYYSGEHLMLNFKASCFWAQTLLYLLYVQKEYTKEFICSFCDEQHLLLVHHNVEDIMVYLLWIDQRFLRKRK